MSPAEQNRVSGIDVVLRTRNRPEWMEAALRSILAADRRGIEVKIYVVDNASTDDTADRLASFSQREPELVVPLLEKRLGAQHALNAGVAAGSAPIVACFDDDELVAPDWLQVIAATMRRSEIDFIGGPCRPLWECEPPDWLPEGFSGVLGFYDAPFAEPTSYSEIPGSMMTQGNCAIRRGVLEAVGPFPDQFVTAEDAWFNAQARSLGYEGFCVPDMVIYHRIPASRVTKQYFRRWMVREGRDAERLQRLSSQPSQAFQPWFWRSTWQASMRMLRAHWRGKPSDQFRAELQVRQNIHYAIASVRHRLMRP